MRFWTAHLRPGAGPVLVREGFSWGALLFGPLWLAAHRAWVPAALNLAVAILLFGLTAGGTRAALWLALVVLQGVSGRDLVRWSLDRRGYVMAHVVAARDAEAALSRLLQGRPDQARLLAGAVGPRA